MAPKRKAASTQDTTDKKAKTSPVSAKSVAALFVKAKQTESKPPTAPLQVPKPKAVSEEPWTSKHAPRQRSNLVVHKKKIQEVEAWLDAALQSHGKGSCQPCDRCCCISGPTGSGRSTTLHMLAKERGAQIEAWALPNPTLWAEHKHLSEFQSQYSSKLDAFQQLVSRAQFAGLPLTASSSAAAVKDGSSTGSNTSSQLRNGATTAAVARSMFGSQDSSQQSLQEQGRPARKINLIADFPHIHSGEARQQMCDMLQLLITTTGAPTVIIVTESGQSSGNDDSIAAGPGQKRFRNLEHMIIDTAAAAGALHIKFNPITARLCIKELKRIATAEGFAVDDDALSTIVEASHCDLFNAIQALRMHLLGTGVRGAKLSKGSRGRGKVAKQAGKANAGQQQRDMGLRIFHALGKILHNKRFNAAGERVQHGPRAPASDVIDVEMATEGGLATQCADADGAKQDVSDPTMAPEEVVARSGLDAATVTGFLFENYADYVDDCAIEDAAEAAAGFSDAMHMIKRSGQAGEMSWIDPDFATKSPADAAASCFACRGYMWFNQHPAPTKFRPTRAPAASAVMRAAAQNRAELTESVTRGRGAVEPASQMAVQVLPYARLLVAAYPSHPAQSLLPMRWQRMWQGKLLDEQGGGAPEAAPAATVPATSEDEIEED